MSKKGKASWSHLGGIRRKLLLSILGMTWASCRTSRPTMVNVSISSWCVIATHEHINSAPPGTCLQRAGRSCALGQPGSPNSPTPKFTISKDPGADPTPSEVVSWGGLKQGPHEDPRIKAAPSGASSGRGSTSFTRPSLTHGVRLAPAASTGTGAVTPQNFKFWNVTKIH
jgi:hypothetical protein